MSQPESDMLRKIKETNIHDVEYENLLNKLLKDEVKLNGKEFKVDQKGLILFKIRIYMPDVVDLKLFVLNSIHRPPYVGNPGYKKMTTTLRNKFFWPNLKEYLLYYLSKCLEC